MGALVVPARHRGRGGGAMLTYGKLAPGDHSYYLDAVAGGAEEYYTRAPGEAPGRWMGKGAARLGLSGRVTEQQLRAVLDGRAPDGSPLIRKQGRERRPGFDCTISAPKSVSLLWALGPPEVSRQVREAHDAAVEAAMAVLQDEACYARRGRGGTTQVDGDGFAVAAFRHRTSREGDPQIHTHALIANVVHSPFDDRWTALDSSHLYGWGTPVGYLYEAKLRVELTRRLGVRWTTTKKGISEIEGIPKPVLDVFSKRRQQIEKHMEREGTTGAKAAQVATYATRQAKDAVPSFAELLTHWRETAAEIGFDNVALTAVLGLDHSRTPLDPGSREARTLVVQLALASGLTERKPTFNRRDVIMQICNRLPQGAEVDEVLALADAFLQSREVVPLVCGDTDQIRRKDGRSAPIRTDPSRFTTREMLQVEADLLRLVTSGRTAAAGRADAAAVDRAVANRATLAAEQADMVRRVCRSGAGVDVVEGAAGAGKTFGLAAAYEAWSSSGFRVIGTSLAARAARELEKGSGIPSTTLHRLLADLGRPESGGLGPHHVVVVDEAATVGTRRLLDLVRHARRGNAKVVLIGDPCQLPAVDAGGAFDGLARRGKRSVLVANRRQKHAWERQALSDMRSGRAEEAVAAYLANGRVHHDDDLDVVRERVVDDWWRVIDDGDDAVMLALHRRQVEELNLRARERIRAAGRLGGDDRAIGDRCFAVGDVVLAHQNDGRLGIINGDRGKVTAIDDVGGRLRVDLDSGTTLEVPFEYLEAGHLTHGYASTIHKTQGATVDVAHVLVHPSMTREQLYSALSRGRERNTMYASPDEIRAEFAHVAEVQPELEEMLLSIMRRSSAESMAVDAGGIDVSM